MRNSEKNKSGFSFLFVVILFILGAVSGFVFRDLFVKHNERSEIERIVNKIETETKMHQERVAEIINSGKKNFDDGFGVALSKSVNHVEGVFEEAKNYPMISDSKSSIAFDEDEDNYYYKLELKGFDSSDVDVDVKDQVLSFKAKKKISTDNSFSDSSFFYSFPVPQFDEDSEPKIVRKDGKILVELKKAD